MKPRVAKVLARQQPELPQMVRNVLANVGDRAIRAHDHLGVLIRQTRILHRDLLRRARPPHHQAALVLPRRLLIQHAALHHQRARRVPEVQAENLALARQKIVLDPKPLHRLQMPPQHGGRDQLRNRRRLVAAGLQRVQRLQPNLLARASSRRGRRRVVRRPAVPLADPRVQVPAIEVDALARRTQLGQQRARRSSVFPSRCTRPTTTSATCTPVLSM